MQIITPEEAALLIQNEHTVAVSGFMLNLVPLSFISALEKRFVETGGPRDLTYIFSSGQSLGARSPHGLNQLAKEGLLKRTYASHYAVNYYIGQMAIEEKIEAFNLPMGVMAHLYRDMAAGKPGTVTHVGLKTFMDPRFAGGKMNQRARDCGFDTIELVELGGKEQLFYHAIPIDVCVIRGTWADERGNIGYDKEGIYLDVTAMAQATRRFGGKVIVQVEGVVKSGSLNPKDVKVPGIYVDYIMPVGKENMTEYDSYLSPAATGAIRAPGRALPGLPLGIRKIIARRAALELKPASVVNLGVGMPESISLVANEEGITDYMNLTVESGPIGGVVAEGTLFGLSFNPEAILNQSQQFDFYDGGGIDLAFLGSGEVDENGNVNVSDLGNFLTGCGGFINITQNAKNLFFIGAFTAKGLEIKTGDGRLTIVKEGTQKKFLKKVRQITFSGEYAKEIKQPVLYISERAVFEQRQDGIHLIEIAPGIDLQKDVLAHMDFTPKMDKSPKLMDSRIFMDKPMGLK